MLKWHSVTGLTIQVTAIYTNELLSYIYKLSRRDEVRTTAKLDGETRLHKTENTTQIKKLTKKEGLQT